MHNSIIVAFLVSAVAIAPLAGMWKAHLDAKAHGWQMRTITSHEGVRFTLNAGGSEAA